MYPPCIYQNSCTSLLDFHSSLYLYQSVSRRIQHRIMSFETIPAASLRTGVDDLAIPLLGLGTFSYPSDHAVTKQAVLDAIELGYRHIDTASIYGSEGPIGEAVSEALHRGLISSRDELFITSKLWCSDAAPELVLPALRRTLQNLGLERIDLYLIHWPLSMVPGKYEPFITVSDLLPFDLPGVWAAMEECQRVGLTRAIGVSNFSCEKLDDLLRVSKIPPAVSQVEINPLWRQKELREYCKEKGIHVTAYAPLGGQDLFVAKNKVLVNEELIRIAHAKGKTVAQVCLRWAYEQGVSAIFKSFNKNRMKENKKIFDWELTNEDKYVIDNLPQQKTYPINIGLFGDMSPMVQEMIDNDIM